LRSLVLEKTADRPEAPARFATPMRTMVQRTY
jgi:hypothetical protein